MSIPLKLVEDLTPEDYRKRYRDAHADAEKYHSHRVADAERAFASTLTIADAKRRAAIESAPKVSGELWNKGAVECGCPIATEAAEAAYRKTRDEADDLRIRTIERSCETLAQDINAAKRASEVARLARLVAMNSDRYPREWYSSPDFAERFCGCLQMVSRNIHTTSDLAEAVRMIAEYRRWFRGALIEHGHRIH